MKDEDYKAWFLEGLTVINDEYFVLDVRPVDYNDTDFYAEIHLDAVKETFKAISQVVGDYIFIDLLSPTHLEVYQGETYEDSSTDCQQLPYKSIAYKTIEKGLRAEWKPKYLALHNDFRKAFHAKAKKFEIAREPVVMRFQEIYEKELSQAGTFGLLPEELHATGLFKMLLNVFKNNPGWDDLNYLVDPDFQSARTPKDWKAAWSTLNDQYKTLIGIDVEDYPTIRDHMIGRYSSIFDHLLARRMLNQKNINALGYTLFFESLIDSLRRTT